MTKREALTASLRRLRQSMEQVGRIVGEALAEAERQWAEKPVTRTEDEARTYCEEHGIHYVYAPGNSEHCRYVVGGVGATSHALALGVYLGEPSTDALPATVGECAVGSWERVLSLFRYAAIAEPEDASCRKPTPAEAVAAYVALYGVPPVRGETDD